MTHSVYRLRTIAGGCLLLSGSGLAYAQTDASGASSDRQASRAQISEIVVTAQRRGENLQDVPIAITAIGGAALERASVTNTTDLEITTPALVMANNSANVKPFIRGIGAQGSGAGIENSVATYVDGVYYAAQSAATLSLGDIERVEILKGPQGTLFGRNSTGGVIQVVTKDPGDHLAGAASLSYGNYKAVKGTLDVSGPLAPDLAASFTASAEHHGNGFGRDMSNGAKVNKLDLDLALRAKLLWTPGEMTRIMLTGDYARVEGYVPFPGQAPGTTTPYGGQRPGSTWDTNQNVRPSHLSESYGVAGRIEHEFADFKLTSISAWRQALLSHPVDLDGTPTPAVGALVGNRDRQLSQEIHLASTGDSRLQWLVGGYYFHLKTGLPDGYYVRTGGPLPFSDTRTISTQKSESLSIFGQATYEIADGTRLTGGLRYTHETVRVNGSAWQVDINGNQIATVFTDVGSKVRYRPLTWRISLDQRITPDMLAYLSYNRGFKSGGFTVASPQLPGYFPERLDAYEAGLKSSLFDQRLRFNIAAFYYDYSNIQITAYPDIGAPRLYNGSKARLYGTDMDLQLAVNEHLTLTGGLSLIHDRFTDFPSAVIGAPRPGGGYVTSPGSAKGNRLPLVPDATFNLAADYVLPTDFGEVAFNVSYMHSTGYYAEPDNQLRQSSYDLVNAAVTLATHDEWSLRIWGKNLANAAVGFYNTVGGSRLAAYQPPRRYGVTLGKKF